MSTRNPWDNPDSPAAVLREVFTAPNEDRPTNTLNVVDALYAIGNALRRLGNANANTHLGGLEGLGVAVIEGSTKIAESLNSVAASIDALAEALSARTQ